HVLQLRSDHFWVSPSVKTFERRMRLFVQIGTLVGIFGVIDPSLGTPYARIIGKGTILLSLQTSPKHVSGILPRAGIPRRHKKYTHLLALRVMLLSSPLLQHPP